jgi:aerobic C4-dicarboxylate transport protein
MTLAMLFLAQATNTDLTLGQQLTILGVAMLTSKGASGVTGAGFVTLAATLTIIPDIPVVALAVLVGIDRFMSECRAITNAIGNGVATLVVARWENELDMEQLTRELAKGPDAPGPKAQQPEPASGPLAGVLASAKPVRAPAE